MSALEASPALTNGRWVKGRGGIRRWQQIESVAAAPPSEMTKPVVVYAAMTCTCGCLIAIGEDCPNCRVWARENEQAANLASGAVYRATTKDGVSELLDGHRCTGGAA